MATLRLFAQAREAAGTNEAEFDGATVDDVLRAAAETFGVAFAAVLASSKVWLNGEQCERSTQVTSRDEVAVLPPVSGG